MTHNSTYRRSPRRRPRHAAPSRPARPYRLRDRRATRLLAIAGSAVVGLGLVVGAVALVAEITALPSASHVTVTAGQKPARHLAAGPPPGGRPSGGAERLGAPGSLVIAQFAGHGQSRTPRFTMTGHGTWRIEWSYDCSALGRPGTFIITAIDAGIPRSRLVDQTGPGGHGITSAYPDAATDYLTVDSRCAWTLRVLAGR
jgi:hypothetical protein